MWYMKINVGKHLRYRRVTACLDRIEGTLYDSVSSRAEENTELTERKEKKAQDGDRPDDFNTYLLALTDLSDCFYFHRYKVFSTFLFIISEMTREKTAQKRRPN
jgi:hypothetical protein